MNFTLLIVLAPLSIWFTQIYIPPNTTMTLYADLPEICNVTGIHKIDGPATITIRCTNNSPAAKQLAGTVAAAYKSPEPPPSPAPQPPLLVVAAAVATAAGLSYVLSNKREALAALVAPIIARLKTAKAEDPTRRQILKIVEQMGAATLSQIVKATGKSWGPIQWHVYVLEREGKLRSVKIGSFTYYYTNPKAAAEVILASVDPDTLTPEDREKLDIMASS